MVNGLSAWKNFDDLEEYLVLDELLLLAEQLGKTKRNEFRMMAAVQGIEVGDDEISSPKYDGDLPKELIEAERKWQKKKAEEADKGLASEFLEFKMGYSKV